MTLPDTVRAARQEREANGGEAHPRASQDGVRAVELEAQREATEARVNQERLRAECRARQAERGTT